MINEDEISSNTDNEKSYGYELKKSKRAREKDKIKSVITPVDDEGGVSVAATYGHYGLFVDIDATAKSESELISRYRDISHYPEVDNAIEEITSEAIAAVDSEAPVTIDLKDLPYSDTIKSAIEEEFDNVLKLLDFNKRAHEIFRRWYIDGRLFYVKEVIEDKKSDGIQKIIYIDPRKIKKVRNILKDKNEAGIEYIKDIEEFFVYNDKGLNLGVNTEQFLTRNTAGLKLKPDYVTFVTSGLHDLDKNMVLSYLHKALKPVNLLKMMVDAMVIYRISRSAERRIFYIDVGDLPKNKAEEYMRSIMTKYKNKLVFDASSGEIKDNRHFTNMLEDYWLPRRADGRGTQIDTLRGAENLGAVQDIELLQNKLYNSLNVPASRFTQQSNVLFGRQAEISREELKFAKFINRLRRRFNELFNDLLKTNLILKNVITKDGWEEIKHYINYRYTQDQYFQEIKEGEILRNRIDLINQVQPYLGVYFDKNYVYKEILKMSDDEIDRAKQGMQKDFEEDQATPKDQHDKQVGSIQAGALTRSIDNPAPQSEPKDGQEQQ